MRTLPITPSAIPEDISDLSERVAALERRLGALDTLGLLRGGGFARSGAVTVGISPPWSPPTNCRLDRTLFLLGSAGSSETVVRTILDGTVIAETTIPVGAIRALARHGRSMAADETVLRYEIVVGGADAEDLSILPRFVPS